MKLYIAYTNSDCTEGRGVNVPIAVSTCESTAIRMAKKAYVQGSDGPVREVDCIKIENRWYVPLYGTVALLDPTEDDIRAQDRLNTKRFALRKAQELGLTLEDIRALQQ